MGGERLPPGPAIPYSSELFTRATDWRASLGKHGLFYRQGRLRENNAADVSGARVLAKSRHKGARFVGAHLGVPAVGWAGCSMLDPEALANF